MGHLDSWETDVSGVEMFDLGCGGFLLVTFKATRIVAVLRGGRLREGMWIFDWRWIGVFVLRWFSLFLRSVGFLLVS